MKQILIPGLGAILGAVIVMGCNTTQQTTAYKTIGATETTAQAALDGYYTLVINGTVSTNEVTQVSLAYNQLQADAVLAASLSQDGTNALETTNLVNDLSDLDNVITTATKLK
jgi:hypothetical protein